MRWDDLFADLEAHATAASLAERSGQVDELTRAERSAVTLADRLRQAQGRVLSVQLLGGAAVEGPLVETGESWFVLGGAAPGLVPVHGVVAVRGLPHGGRSPAGVGHRRSLASVLRVVARDRGPVRVHAVDGYTIEGTVDAVLEDHLQLAEHHLDVPRRAAAVRSVAVVPLAALALLRPAGPSSLG
ncbi:hypothetical protein [Angustibacter aerolatus]